MKQQWNIRPMRDSETDAVSKLAIDCFIAQVAPHYGRQGIDTYTRYVAPDALVDRCSKGSDFLVAEAHGVLVGMAELRGGSHLGMLFVADKHRRRGVGRALVRTVIRACAVRYPDVHSITVNSAPNSVDAYIRYGFTRTGPEREQDGIRFVPMRMSISQDRA